MTRTQDNNAQNHMDDQKIGRYLIKTEVGRGGMATVFLAYDPRFEREVAIKVLPFALLHDPQFRVRFEREAKTIALLEHPAIVPVYDFGEENGQPYIVMRYMSGGSLANHLNSGPLSLDETVKIISRLAPALDAAHSKGIIHRDLKPGNILFDQYGNAFLSDFGIARLTQQVGLTLTGDTIVGTPAYMSPEQVQGDKDLDSHSDIYSLGIILYQMLTGRAPYQADTPARTMMMHLLEPVPNLREIRPDLPASCEAVIFKALAKDANQRFNTAGEMAQSLEKAARGEQLPNNLTMIAPKELATQRHAKREIIADTVMTPSQQFAVPHPRTLPPKLIPFLVGFLALLCLGVVIGGGIAFIKRVPAFPLLPTITTTSTNIPVIIPSLTLTAFPTVVTPPTPSPSATATITSLPTESPTQTPLPTETPLPTNIPTETPTVVLSGPVIGGADKIAFFNANDIWVANLDGNELMRLTNDGAGKTNLQWSQDGQAVHYIVGKCAQSVNISTGKIDILACFEAADFLEAFQISPDSQQVAISLNRELFIVPYDLTRLNQARYHTDLIPMADCTSLAPYPRNAVKKVLWSVDGKRLAVVILGAEGNLQVDLVHILDISSCLPAIPRLDEFPALRFRMDGYSENPFIQTFSWDGSFLFALASFKRNDGYGDLWIYNADLHRGENIAPIDNVCCYRDPYWSPDGRFLLFTFQDIRLAPASVIKLYYIPFGTIGTGMKYVPLPLPDDFFANPREKPQAILRPAK